MSKAKRDRKDNGPPPEKPEPPQAVRYVVSDTTVEALAPLLQENPRGLLLARDELAGWIGSFDRYSGGKGGADAAHWLSMHNGESILVDRKAARRARSTFPRHRYRLRAGYNLRSFTVPLASSIGNRGWPRGCC